MHRKSTEGTLRVGTRRSALAKTQTRWVVEHLTRIHPQLQIEVLEIVTTGDRVLDTSLDLVPGKGVFVKEIEDRLLSGEIDLAVHSLKDLPTELPDGLCLGAVPERVDPRDVFVTRLGCPLTELPEGARVGTGSLRRKVQVLQIRPDLQIVDLRGNIDTRLRKAETDRYDGIILAAAGLKRMGWEARIQEYFSCEAVVPAVGQGALGVEVRQEDDRTRELVAPLHHEATARAVEAERAFLLGMGGGCRTPVAAFCRVRDGQAEFVACRADEDGGNFRKLKLEGPLENARDLAQQAVEELLTH